MAKKTKKEKTIEHLDRKLAKTDKLLKNWRKYGISELKISRMEAKETKYKAQKVKEEAS